MDMVLRFERRSRPSRPGPRAARTTPDPAHDGRSGRWGSAGAGRDVADLERGPHGLRQLRALQGDLLALDGAHKLPWANVLDVAAVASEALTKATEV